MAPRPRACCQRLGFCWRRSPTCSSTRAPASPRLILDTGVLIAERASSSWADALTADDDVALAAVSVAELRTGVELASAGRRVAREALRERVLTTIPVERYLPGVECPQVG